MDKYTKLNDGHLLTGNWTVDDGDWTSVTWVHLIKMYFASFNCLHAEKIEDMTDVIRLKYMYYDFLAQQQ